MAQAARRVGQVAYGGVFVVLLPWFLWSWARACDAKLTFRAARSLPLGIALAASGVALMIAGWAALAVRGGGLPMNAFPPPRYVRSGPYRWVSHPIYVGFCCAVLGTALAAGSPSGQWLVFPTCVLGCVALVYGYERRDLARRFGALHRPCLALPSRQGGGLKPCERASVYALVIAPWLLIYEAIATLGVPPDARSTVLAFERGWPVLAAFEPLYASVYVAVLVAPLVLARRGLGRLCRQALLAMAWVFPLYLALPLIAPPRPFVASSVLGSALALERALDTPACAFPSFHVIWALIIADSVRRHRVLASVWAVTVLVSCVATGMHSVLDVLAGLFIFVLVRRQREVWRWLRKRAEAVANSWREWRMGPVRFISHGAWALLGTTLGLLLMAAVLGPGSERLLACLWCGGLMGAALWAQWLEGASGLSRPYGFYGGVLGMVLVALLAPALGYGRLHTLAACAIGGPVVQAFGRLRCLVQGCCHGSLCSPGIGIAYRHPRSRVSKYRELVERPLHPTPLYSILWNVPVFVCMVRLASLHASAELIAGTYLILNGCGRFLEESFRGEPQTPVIARLRIYQWFALSSVVAGAALTAWGSGEAVALRMPDAALSTVALLCGIANLFALGVDFPESTRRFSRLA